MATKTPRSGENGALLNEAKNARKPRISSDSSSADEGREGTGGKGKEGGRNDGGER